MKVAKNSAASEAVVVAVASGSRPARIVTVHALPSLASVVEVAERMRMTEGDIARLESGERMPSTSTLQKYAEATGTRLKISFEPVSTSG